MRRLIVFGQKKKYRMGRTAASFWLLSFSRAIITFGKITEILEIRLKIHEKQLFLLFPHIFSPFSCYLWNLMHWHQKLWVKLELFCSHRNLLNWHGRVLNSFCAAWSNFVCSGFDSVCSCNILFIVIVKHHTNLIITTQQRWMIDNWKHVFRCKIWFLSLASRFGDYMINPAMCRWSTPISAFSVLFILYNPLILTLPEGRCPQPAFCKMLIFVATFPLLYSMLNSSTAGSLHLDLNTCHPGVREKMSVQIAQNLYFMYALGCYPLDQHFRILDIPDGSIPFGIFTHAWSLTVIYSW